jgi:pyroglutamyl-peptidase
MKKLLISGFEPFGDEKINPSWDAVSRLPDRIGEYSITKLMLSVTFGEAANRIIECATELCPDVIISVGQAGGRRSITPELVGINLRYAKIPDNNGFSPKDEPIIQNGKDAYFSTLPVRRMADAIAARQIPSELSYSAGAYVCNEVLYRLLSHFDGTSTRVGFIHVPYSTAQGKEPSMELSDIIKGLTVAIESLDI